MINEKDDMKALYTKLHIFTKEGKTFTFIKIYRFDSNESVISFDYIAQSDKLIKRSIFYVNNIAGYSLCSE